jgi:hypothetical protein
MVTTFRRAAPFFAASPRPRVTASLFPLPTPHPALRTLNVSGPAGNYFFRLYVTTNDGSLPSPMYMVMTSVSASGHSVTDLYFVAGPF